jgi:hypothetical protein
MAQILRGPTVGQQLGQRISSPIVSSLQRLANMQLENMQRQRERSNIFAGLSALMPKEEAQALSQLPPNMINQVLRNRSLEARRGEQEAAREAKTAAKAPTRLNSLLKLKNTIYPKYLSDPNEVEFDLQNADMEPVEKKILKTNRLDNEIMDYFLRATVDRDGQMNPEKAERMAKRFGFSTGR